ncbi:23S rRNA (adenine(2503)-C(2))-methyltransferase RlmN [bacterium]|nr:23S rRNA (adenine(2503)-C(2))-methyltransferase RlmN [bacterium]
MLKPLLHSLVPEELEDAVAAVGQPAWRGRQVRDWLHRHPVRDWAAMSNVPGPLRHALAEKYDLWGLVPTERQVSRDGTRKFLFTLRDGATVESVIIPMNDHTTFCISSQVGCAMACRFCATARGGLVRNLEPGEIVQQVLHLLADLQDEPMAGMGDRQPNVVFMGMGEPLDNFPAVERSILIMQHEAGLGISRRRIRISTSGPEEGLEMLLGSDLQVGLTLSIGGSDDQERRRIMPVPGRTTLARAADLAAEYAARVRRRTTIAWVMIEGRTDEPEQARRIAALVAGRPFKVNLIPLNPLDDDKLASPPFQKILAFQSILKDAGVDTFIRASGGQDIAAACGQLRRRRLTAGPGK